MIHAVLYIHSQKGICALGQRNSPFFVILLFSLDPLESFKGSRDEAGIQAAACEIQAQKRSEKRESLAVFAACFVGGSKALRATCGLHAPCTGTRFQW